MWAVQKPINGTISDEVAGPPSWKSIPSWYLVGDDDQIIPPAAQEQLATRGGATIDHTPGSHVALVTHPDAVWPSSSRRSRRSARAVHPPAHHLRPEA
jgi:hypothetical protein